MHAVISMTRSNDYFINVDSVPSSALVTCDSEPACKIPQLSIYSAKWNAVLAVLLITPVLFLLYSAKCCEKIYTMALEL